MILQRLIRRCFNTKPSRRAKPKLDHHAPNTAGEPITLDNGCIFIDLAAKKDSASLNTAPIIRNLGGNYISPEKIDEIKALRNENRDNWTVTKLAKKYGVSRSFVISNVLTSEEQAKYKGMIEGMIADMSIKEQKGWILRHKIKRDREESW